MTTPTDTPGATAASVAVVVTFDDRGYAMGLGEVVRSRRQYLGLSQVGMAKRLGMDRRSLQRIENGTEGLRQSLLDDIDDLVVQFDDRVDAIIDSARRHCKFSGSKVVVIAVSTDPTQEWERAAVSRAAVDEPWIIPVIDPKTSPK